ncbi:anti-sigma factor [Micromonospora cathayae]|uniref:Anti-sigma factor n=1 Tax=Micromonospora cathayae TaxID=3028804 RepID=A0ABY7ZW93_9ACTN|nr:anti-sigma factor [Micromonospora sp. HUAS 3]WDZ87319.1 anti-sigma factor [Micromonospora sp. HUAS 3]
MQHLEHDRLVFLALGESEADTGENHHLDGCAHCRAELAALRHVAGLGAETQALRDLPEPPPQIWDAITAEVAAAQSLPTLTRPRRPQPATGNGTAPHTAGNPTGPDTAGNGTGPYPAGNPTDRNARGHPTGPNAAGGGTGPTAGGRATGRNAAEDGTGPRPVGTGPGAPAARPGRRSRRVSRWLATGLTATAAAVLGVVGTLTVVRPDAPEPPPQVLASAPLAAYGATPPEATGDARVFADGRLHLHVANLPEVPGYYEVWLIDPATMEMFSVGVLGGGADALLPLPPNVDLDRYSVVDVSAEQYDNDTAHSGDSLLRGTLTS